jgi:long-chain acyl-CoA synthetase
MIGEILLSQFHAGRNQTAIIEGREIITYQSLADWSMAWAGYFRDQCGWKAGDCVAVQLPNVAAYPALFASLSLLGVGLLPVHLDWKPEEVARNLRGKSLAGIIAREIQLRAWAAHSLFSALPQVALENLLVLNDQASVSTANNFRGSDFSQQEALHLMTSGTSGQPKIVVRTQSNLLANARQVARALDWKPGCRILPVTPFSHANGFSNGMLLPMLSGACLFLLPQFFPARLAELLRQYCIEIMIASPFVYSTLLNYGLSAAETESFWYALSSGAPLPDAVACEAARQWRVPIRNLYGSSETGTISIESMPESEGKKTAGAPLESVEVRILSEAHEPLPLEQAGLIAVRSPAVMKGYWTVAGIDPARNAEGFYLTGDRGFLDRQGNLNLLGRVQQTLNMGGNKVSALEIEEVLCQLPGVLRCRVRGMDHPQLHQTIHATLWPEPGFQLHPSEVLTFCRQHLAEHKIPRQISIEPCTGSDLPAKNL